MTTTEMRRGKIPIRRVNTPRKVMECRRSFGRDWSGALEWSGVQSGVRQHLPRNSSVSLKRRSKILGVPALGIQYNETPMDSGLCIVYVVSN